MQTTTETTSKNTNAPPNVDIKQSFITPISNTSFSIRPRVPQPTHLQNINISGKSNDIRQLRLTASSIWIVIISTAAAFVLGLIGWRGFKFWFSLEGVFIFFSISILQLVLMFFKFKTLIVQYLSCTTLLRLITESTKVNQLILLGCSLVTHGYMLPKLSFRMFAPQFIKEYSKCQAVQASINPHTTPSWAISSEMIQLSNVDCTIVDERDSLVVVFGLLLSLLLFLRYVAARDYQLVFPLVQQKRRFRFYHRIRPMLEISLRTSVVSLLLFVIITLPFDYQFVYQHSKVVLQATDPQAQASWLSALFGSHLFDIRYLFSLGVCGIFVSLCYEITHSVLAIIYTETANFLNGELLVAMTNPSQYIQYLGFFHAYVSMDSTVSVNRKYLFGDETGKTLKFFVQTCCDLIDNMSIGLILTKKAYLAAPKTQQPRRPAWGPDPEEALFASLQPIIWAIQSSSKLISRSIEEDRIGVVQNTESISTLLYSLLGALLAIEDYISILDAAETNSNFSRGVYHSAKYIPTSIALASWSQRRSKIMYNLEKLNMVYEDQFARNHPALLIAAALQSGIYNIVTTFYSYLDAFEFPPKYAAKLQSFVDFKE